MRLRIENLVESGSEGIAGYNTRVIAIREDGQEFDISPMVRAADVRLHVGEPVTATLECFVTEVETRAELEAAFIRELKPKKIPFFRRVRDISGFGSQLWKEYVLR